MLSSSEKYELKKKFRHLEAEICKLDTALDSKADLVDGVVPTSQLPITQDIIDALNNANAPNGINYFTTLADLSSITPGTLINVVSNYAALPAANTVPGEFYWVENAQGTSWLPGPLGGTYYPNGLYYSNGTTWIFTDVPFNATQVEVDAGINNNKFLTPMTFENAAKWSTKVSSVTGPAVDNTDPLNPVITIPTNLTFYSTTAAGAVPGYNKLVISLDDPDYNTIPVDVSTGAISGLAQPVGALVSDAGIFAGNPGTINVNTLGEIRRVSGTGTVEFYYEIYQRDSGGTETLIATSNLTPPVTTSVYQQFQASALFNNGTWAATDRVVIKYYANRIPGGSDPVYEFLFGGTNPVKTLFPISASLLLNVPIAIGVTGVTGGTPGSALTVGPTGLLSQLAFDSTPTNGSVNPVTSDGVYDALQLKQDNVTLTTTGTSGAATLVGSTLNIPQYQSVLTNPVTGTGTAGQVAYWNGTTTQTGSNLMFWDATNNRLGIWTSIPSELLHVAGNMRFDGVMRDNRSNTIIAQSASNITTNRTLTFGNATYKDIIFPSSNVLIGNTDGTGRLTVRGSGTTSATTALLVQNSTPTNLLQILDNGRINQTIPGATNNTIFGTDAGASASLTGVSNTFFGVSAGQNNTTGGSNTFFGVYSGQNNTTGGSNTFFGVYSGQNNTTGGNNSFFGFFAGINNTTGSNNTFFGVSAGRNNTTGNDNTFFGVSAGRNNTTGNDNTFFGVSAGRYIADGVTALTVANNSVFLGFDTRAAADSQTNQIVIGYQAIGLGSNTTVIGNSSTTLTWLGGSTSIGTTTNSARLHVQGSGTTSATTALLVQNSTPTELFKVRDNGAWNFNGDGSVLGGIDVRKNTGIIAFFGATNSSRRLEVLANGDVLLGLVGWIPTTNGGNSTTVGGGGCFIGYNATGDLAYSGVTSVTLGRPLNRLLNATSGQQQMVDIVGNFSPTSGTATFYDLSVKPTINQTGGANGITRGLYVNPTLTSAADWRGIESVAASNANHTLLKLRNATVDVFTVKSDSTIGFFNATPVGQATNTTAINDVLVNIGLRASGGISNFSNDVRVDGVLLETVTTNRQTASYTLALSDRGKLVEMNVATANDLTIPLDSSVAFPVGTKIDIVQYGAGQTTIVATGGVTIRSTNNWKKINARYGAVTLVKVATDEWYVFGNLNA